MDNLKFLITFLHAPCMHPASILHGCAGRMQEASKMDAGWSSGSRLSTCFTLSIIVSNTSYNRLKPMLQQAEAYVTNRLKPMLQQAEAYATNRLKPMLQQAEAYVTNRLKPMLQQAEAYATNRLKPMLQTG